MNKFEVYEILANATIFQTSTEEIIENINSRTDSIQKTYLLLAFKLFQQIQIIDILLNSVDEKLKTNASDESLIQSKIELEQSCNEKYDEFSAFTH